jgi:hypothetical protein
MYVKYIVFLLHYILTQIKVLLNQDITKYIHNQSVINKNITNTETFKLAGCY